MQKNCTHQNYADTHTYTVDILYTNVLTHTDTNKHLKTYTKAKLFTHAYPNKHSNPYIQKAAHTQIVT